jgi:hypothetical protein
MNQEEKDNYVMLLEFELDVVGGNGYLNGTSGGFMVFVLLLFGLYFVFSLVSVYLVLTNG